MAKNGLVDRHGLPTFFLPSPNESDMLLYMLSIGDGPRLERCINNAEQFRKTGQQSVLFTKDMQPVTVFTDHNYP